jgi:ribosome-associated protein
MRRTRKRKDSNMDETDPLTKAKWIVEAALELRAERPISLDMSKLTSYADTFVILTGRSDRQVRAIADSIIQTLKAHGDAPLGVEGLDDGNWVLIDCNDAIVHVFDPETRTQYDLERLWRDAPRIDLGIPGLDPNPEAETGAGAGAETTEDRATEDGADAEDPAA